jgi:hypothetical protein
MPLARMTFPAHVVDLVPATVALDRRLFRSWILLFGFLPVDYDDLTLCEIEPERRFLERSPMLSQRTWEHERTIEPVPHGCRVCDHVRFEPRIALLGAVYAPIFRAAFALRHRNLRRLFGTCTS